MESALGNIVGNNHHGDAAAAALSAGGGNSNAQCVELALGTGFSSNMVIFGSLAGIVVVEQAKACGVNIFFMDFAKAGLQVALICIVLSAFWVLWL